MSQGVTSTLSGVLPSGVIPWHILRNESRVLYTFFFLLFPIPSNMYCLRPNFSSPLPFVTQIRGHIAGIPARVHFYRGNKEFSSFLPSSTRVEFWILRTHAIKTYLVGASCKPIFAQDKKNIRWVSNSRNRPYFVNTQYVSCLLSCVVCCCTCRQYVGMALHNTYLYLISSLSLRGIHCLVHTKYI